MIKVAITGGTGLIGSRIIELLSNFIEFIPLSHRDLEITDRANVEKKLNEIEFDVFLHLAAYTNVDGAETEKEKAYAINVTGTKNTYEVVKNKGKKYIYLSTDFVFDGTTPPYSETSMPNPIGYYGQTKYEGEQVIKDGAMIVRIAYPYRTQFEQKKDFVRTLKSLLEQGKQLTMVTDSSFTPTFIDDIAYGLQHCIENHESSIVHLVGSQTLSPFDAANHIAKTFNLDSGLISPITYDEYFKNKAKRPQYSEVISNKNTFHKMKTFEEGLQIMQKALESK